MIRCQGCLWIRAVLIASFTSNFDIDRKLGQSQRNLDQDVLLYDSTKG